MRLKDMSIVITGSGRGIGRSIAIRCAEEGARVVINDINPSSLQEARTILESRGAKVIAFMGDISKRSEAQRLIESTVKGFGRIDGLVNNAGIGTKVPFLELTEEDWDEVIKVNLKAMFNCGQYAVRQMVKQGEGGRIINISSRAYLGIEGNGSLLCFKGWGPRSNTIHGDGAGSVRNYGQCCGPWDD